MALASRIISTCLSEVVRLRPETPPLAFTDVTSIQGPVTRILLDEFWPIVTRVTIAQETVLVFCSIFEIPGLLIGAVGPIKSRPPSDKVEKVLPIICPPMVV